MQKMQYEEAGIEIIEFGIACTTEGLIGNSTGDGGDTSLDEFLNPSP